MIYPHEPTLANDDVMLGAHIGTPNQLEWEQSLSYWLAVSKPKNG